MPAVLLRRAIPGTSVVVDPCAALLVLIVTGLLCVGIREVFLPPPCSFSLQAEAALMSLASC